MSEPPEVWVDLPDGVNYDDLNKWEEVPCANCARLAAALAERDAELADVRAAWSRCIDERNQLGRDVRDLRVALAERDAQIAAVWQTIWTVESEPGDDNGFPDVVLVSELLAALGGAEEPPRSEPDYICSAHTLDPSGKTVATCACRPPRSEPAGRDAREPGPVPCSQFQPPPGGGFICYRCGQEYQYHPDGVDSFVPPDRSVSVSRARGEDHS